jgi:F-type H+-transporting ATPase subunit delta
MAELATVARPYAEALFRVAQNGDMAAWSGTGLGTGADRRQPGCAGFTPQPERDAGQLADTIASLVKSPLNAEANNFIAMLAENGRVALLPEIGAQFRAEECTGRRCRREIYSAFELSATSERAGRHAGKEIWPQAEPHGRQWTRR